MTTVELIQSLTLQPTRNAWQIIRVYRVNGTPMERTHITEYPTVEDALGAIAEHVGVKTAIIPGKAGVP